MVAQAHGDYRTEGPQSCEGMWRRRFLLAGQRCLWLVPNARCLRAGIVGWPPAGAVDKSNGRYCPPQLKLNYLQRRTCPVVVAELLAHDPREGDRSGCARSGASTAPTTSCRNMSSLVHALVLSVHSQPKLWKGPRHKLRSRKILQQSPLRLRCMSISQLGDFADAQLELLLRTKRDKRLSAAPAL